MPVYKDKERGTWYFDIRYRDSMGKVRSIKRRGFETKQIAINAERKMNRDLTKDDLPKSTLSIREIGLEMLEDKKHDIREQTYEALKHKITTFIPNTMISSVTVRKALSWRNDLDNLTYANNKPYSTKYKNEIIHLYKSIFKYALKFDYIPKDVTVDVPNFRKRYEDQFDYQVVSAEEFFEKWHALPEKTQINIWFKLFVLLSFSNGARRSELKALMFKDYDGKGITINKSITGKDSDRAKISLTKTKASVRHVGLDDFTIKQLNDYIKSCKNKKEYSPSKFIFGFNTPLPNNTIQTNFKKMNFGCRLHDLRHSHATILIQNKVPINIVSKRLGHSNVEMTLRVYTHAFNEDQDQAVSVLNKLINS